jgi:hypothetical protein
MWTDNKIQFYFPVKHFPAKMDQGCSVDWLIKFRSSAAEYWLKNTSLVNGSTCGVKRAGSLRLAWCVSAIGYMVMKTWKMWRIFISCLICVAWYFYSLSYYCLSWNGLIACPAMKISNQVLLLLSFVSLIFACLNTLRIRYAIIFSFFNYTTRRNCNIACRFDTHIYYN